MQLLEQINDIPDGFSITKKLDLNKINVAKIISGDHTSYVHLADNDNKVLTTEKGTTRLEPIIPYKNIERGVYYITGKSGCGKSLIALRLIAQQYHKLYPDNNVFYCCATNLEDD